MAGDAVLVNDEVKAKAHARAIMSEVMSDPSKAAKARQRGLTVLEQRGR